MKDYKSLFAPNLSVGIEAHITEVLLNNKLAWQMKKNSKVARPTCAFWRKDVADMNPTFKQLQKDYQIEISYIKNLLKCFSAETILSYIKDRGLITFRYLPLGKQQIMIYNIWQLECDLKKENQAQAKKAKNVNKENLTTEVSTRKTLESDLTGLL